MKKIIALLLVLVMVLALAACGGGSKKTTVTMIAAQYGPKTGDWWQNSRRSLKPPTPISIWSWKSFPGTISTQLSRPGFQQAGSRPAEHQHLRQLAG